ncbi:MAG: molybdopterin-guanine dinucleotide biosynthesis protein B [Alphaproteobacteria bacterium]|nr:molybdopterin-guanine dinucleotide biosynthesis protein B [Alphaproteobacteria bacterium]
MIESLLPILRLNGLRVSVIKHAHHGFDIDRAGKDSFRHREAGATEVMLASAERWALLHENRTAGDDDRPEPKLTELVKRMEAVELIIAEGFRTQPVDKIEVFRPSLGLELWAQQDKQVIAVATDEPNDPAMQGLDRTILPLNDPDTIAEFVMKLHNKPFSV